jgi:hypothetical protein
MLFQESPHIAVSTAKVLHLLVAGRGHVEPLPTFADQYAPTSAISVLVPIKPMTRNTVGRVDDQSVKRRDLSGKAIVPKHTCVITHLTLSITGGNQQNQEGAALFAGRVEAGVRPPAIASSPISPSRRV